MAGPAGDSERRAETMTAGRLIANMIDPRPDPDTGFFFIFGVPKSGTTWLQMLLNHHPRICCRSEDQFMYFIKTVPQMLTDYNKVLFRTDNKTANQGPTLCDNGDAERVLTAVIRTIMSKPLEQRGIEYVGAKDNAMIETLPLFQRIFPHSRFIFIVRDPRDVVVSSWFHNLRVEPGFLDRAESLEVWTRKMAGRWRRDITRVREQAAGLGGRLITIRYEDLHNDPVRTAMKLFTFLGLDPDEQQAEQCIEQTRFDRLTGGREPGNELRNSFYRKGIIGDWRNHLSPACNETMLKIAGAVMAEFDYQ